MSDAASLQNLNDIVVSAPAAWWPLAPGWYLLAACLVALLVFLALHQGRRWRQNRYRRQALQELSSIREAGAAGRARELPALLKRTALSAWPRASVASLSGAAWHRFLDETAGMDSFRAGSGATLDSLAYAGRDQPALPEADVKKAIDAAELWLKSHRPAPGDG